MIADKESSQSGDLPPDPEALSLPRDRSICNTTLSSTTPLLQLETRSPGRSNKCISPGLGSSEGLCQPPLEPHRESTSKGGVSGGGASDTNSSNMAVTAMVSRLLSLLVTHPLRIDPQQAAITEDHVDLTPPLAVWPISGNTIKIRNFHQRLQTSSYHHGDRRFHNFTTHLARGGSAGALRGNVIQFQDL